MPKKLRHDRPPVVLVNRSFVIYMKYHRILAIKRAATDSHLPGLWECPGGKLDEGQDLHGALEREVMEETGLLVRPIDTIAHYSSKIIGGKNKYTGMPYVSLFGISTVIGGLLEDAAVKLSHEHDASQWCTYREFMSLDLTPETQNAGIVLAQRLYENGVV